MKSGKEFYNVDFPKEICRIREYNPYYWIAACERGTSIHYLIYNYNAKLSRGDLLEYFHNV